MSTAITKTQQPLLLDYKQLFQGSEPLEDRIAAATARLGMVMDHPIEPMVLMGWTQRLKAFSPEQLTQAFVTAESTLTKWPKPADLIGLILDAEFIADLNWLLPRLRDHKPAWKDKPRREGEWIAAPDGQRGMVREVLAEAVPAPAMPARLAAALKVYGRREDIHAGLEALQAHPACRGEYESTDASSRAWQAIERDFRAIWQAVRMRELTGQPSDRASA